MRAAIYIRVSTEEQAEEGYSLAAQDRACRAYAESQGWSVVDVFADEGISGTKDAGKRPQLARLLTNVRNGTVEAIIVHKLDRLARSVRLTMELIEEFQRRRIAFIAVADRVDLSTPFGWAAFQMQSVFSELCVRNLSFETSKGHTEKARRGLWVGPVPLGYQKDEQGQLVPSPDAPVIQRIFELYGTRVYSYTDIADELNAEGFRTLNWRTGERNLFGRESIRTILRNKAYLGFVSSGGVEYPGTHPPLISAASWETAEALRRERTSASGKSSVRGPAVGGLLTEITYCWKCGARMWYHYSGRAGKRGMYYVCGGRSRRTCDSPFCNATAVEEQLLAVAQALTLPQEWRDTVAQTVNRLLQRPTDPRINRTAIEEKLRRLKRVYLEGDLDDATYQAERSRLQQLLGELGNPQPAPDVARALALLDDLPSLLAAATPTERRAVLRQLFSHVYVEQRDIKALTPKGVYVPLLGEIIARQTTKQDATGGVLKMGCLMGSSPNPYTSITCISSLLR